MTSTAIEKQHFFDEDGMNLKRVLIKNNNVNCLLHVMFVLFKNNYVNCLLHLLL